MAFESVYRIPIDTAMFGNPVDRHARNEYAVNREDDQTDSRRSFRYFSELGRCREQQIAAWPLALVFRGLDQWRECLRKEHLSIPDHQNEREKEITLGGGRSERCEIGMEWISMDACCWCERDRKWSDRGEKDSARLPFPSPEENDGVDNLESKSEKINADSSTIDHLRLVEVIDGSVHDFELELFDATDETATSFSGAVPCSSRWFGSTGGVETSGWLTEYLRIEGEHLRHIGPVQRCHDQCSEWMLFLFECKFISLMSVIFSVLTHWLASLLLIIS